MPLAPVGGTTCAASPARKSRPHCNGSTTKLRMPVIPFWRIWALGWLPAVVAAETQVQLVPDAVVAPLGEILVGPALEIKARDSRRTHAVKSEAAAGYACRGVHRARERPQREYRAMHTDRCARSKASEPAGKNERDTPCEPSQPAMKPHAIESDSPELLR